MAEPENRGRHDVAIIGGGPAGQAAALTLQAQGIDFIVIDEQPRPGGQILRQPPAEMTVANWMTGGAYATLRQQLERFDRHCAGSWRGGLSVLEIRSEGDAFALTVAGMDGVQRILARKVLIAAGCQDLAVPLPGWTLPGVYAAGGIQAFVKSQQIVPGSHILLAGTHPLMVLIGAQIVAAGGTVEAILFAQSRADMARAVARNPALVARHLGTIAPAGRAMALLRRHGVPVRFGIALHAVEGDERVSAVRTSHGLLSCDAVGLCYGFVPQSTLPRIAGAGMRAAGPAGGWAATHDPWMRSSVPGLFVAGETTGVAGAPAALAAGTIAGAGIALDLAAIDAGTAERLAAPARRDHARRLRFAALLDRIADPRPFFPAMHDDTLVCRCEDVALGTLRPLLDGRSANAIKLMSRCGMGACQGRNCEPTLLRLQPDAADPGFTQRFPARPVMIGDLIEPA